jgi:hypothetical protein
MTDYCAECGAVLSEGSTCQTIFNEFLNLEYTNPVYAQVHFLIVACFMIQHRRYSNSALTWMQSKLRDALDEQSTAQQPRPGAAPGMDDVTGTWKFTRQADQLPLPYIAWSMTIADVAKSIQDPEKYCEQVEQWAQTTLKQMDTLFQKSSLISNGILRRFRQWFHEKSNSPQELSLLYMRMRKCIGIIGVALPPVLIIGLILLEGQSKMLDSISVYYYSDYKSDYNLIGNMFVSGMFATGIFLICYQYRLLDDIISTLAGICAIGVALFPTTPPPDRNPNELQMMIGNWHTRFAIGFLILLAVFSLFLFPKSGEKDPKKRTPEKRKRNGVYYGCGIAMLIILVVAGLDLVVPKLNQWLQPIHPTTWLEGLAVEVFGIAWFVKGETFGILKDKDKETLAPEGVQNRATRVVASVLGFLAGLLGVLHGALELFRGNVDPTGIYIFAIDSHCQANRAWHSCFPAMTIIPHYYWVTGVLAIIVSLIIIFWSAVFVQRKNGGLVLILLSIIQLLVGGGDISPILCFIAGLVGTRIQAPFTWWRAHPSFLWQRFLATLWPWSLTFPVIPVAVYAILGYFLNESVLSLAHLPLFFILGLLLLALALAILTGFAHDIQSQTNSHQAPSAGEQTPC